MRLTVGLLVVSLCLVACRGGDAPPTPPVEVEGGRITGIFEEGGEVAVFKGIPFAAPPVDDLRWKPPQPVDSWEGVRDAGSYGPACAQNEMGDGEFLNMIIDGQGMGWFRTALFKLAVGLPAGGERSEDCLYLNVRSANLGGSDKQPVMVWIHGGGHQSGSGSDDFYQSAALVRRGVVLVTINYRLGPLGYFAHPALSAESERGVSGNYGTLDQIAALRWVRDNIAQFGGDPDNVTIFGESAGGESVADMMASPLARGLFHRAIMQSASTGETQLRLKRPALLFRGAEEAGLAFGDEAVGPGNGQIEALRALSTAELFAAYKKSAEFDSDTYNYPVVDGYVLPKSVIAAFRDGEQAPVPLLVGSNADEGTILYDFGTDPLGIAASGPEARAQYEPYVREAFGDDADEALGLYPASSDAELKEALFGIYRDSSFGVKARYYAKQMAVTNQPAYLYFFTRVPPSPDQTIGAFHAVEIAFIFDKPIPLFPTDEQDRVITKTMGDFWAQFAKAGDPNMGGRPEWPAFTESDPLNMVFGPKIGAAPIEHAAAYDLMERHWMRVIDKVGAGE